MKAKFIKSNQKRKIVSELEKHYGIKELNLLLIETGKRKIRGYSGSLSKEEINKLAQTVNIETIGMYIINTRDEDPRLNFDFVSLIREKITKNIIEIDEKQYQKWIRGHDLEFPNTPRGLVVIKFSGELVGVGKSNTEKIFNYVPKERKIKTPLPL